MRIAPPPPPPCLVRPYPSSQKGGTLIAEGVVDLATHRERLCNPDAYRPPQCPRCGHTVLHVHDYRERTLRAEVAAAVVRVVRYRCTNKRCRARWQILPQIIARWLWRTWVVVERVTVQAPPAPRLPPVPARTVRRWAARLQSAARVLVQSLASSAAARLVSVAQHLGLAASRLDLVAGCALSLAALAALIHRLIPGLRLI